MTDTDHTLDLVAAYLCNSDLDKAGRRAQLDALLQVSDGTDKALCLQRLEAAEALAQTARAIQSMAVLDARALGASWTEIGDALGVTKQAVQQRFRSFA